MTLDGSMPPMPSIVSVGPVLVSWTFCTVPLCVLPDESV